MKLKRANMNRWGYKSRLARLVGLPETVEFVTMQYTDGRRVWTVELANVPGAPQTWDGWVIQGFGSPALMRVKEARTPEAAAVRALEMLGWEVEHD